MFVRHVAVAGAALLTTGGAYSQNAWHGYSRTGLVHYISVWKWNHLELEAPIDLCDSCCLFLQPTASHVGMP
jgi:hypothetical protein